MVGWTLIGRPVDDAGMVELLEPSVRTGTARYACWRSAAWPSNRAAAPVCQYSTSPICDGAGPTVTVRQPRVSCSPTANA